ncbi:hypothetical protein EGYY_08060 [Eggerthella sp. YY7918]|nr:hypothetical protein EGYY_08060 [Eggerthella sp. YY7918]
MTAGRLTIEKEPKSSLQTLWTLISLLLRGRAKRTRGSEEPRAAKRGVCEEFFGSIVLRAICSVE